MWLHKSAFHLQAVVFDEFNRPALAKGATTKEMEQEAKAAERFRLTCFHIFSLLHALAIQHLRTDWDLNNLRTHFPTEPAPPLVSLYPTPAAYADAPASCSYQTLSSAHTAALNEIQ